MSRVASDTLTPKLSITRPIATLMLAGGRYGRGGEVGGAEVLRPPSPVVADAVLGREGTDKPTFRSPAPEG
jgi:hypothetical protein